MSMRSVVFGALSLAVISARWAPSMPTPSESRARDQVAVRQIGALERVTRDSLQSVSAALPMPDGRVLVNDPRSRRILLLDSTLSNPRAILDSTAATANAYGRGSGGALFRFKGDSALYLDQNALTMFVITPAGEIARVMAFPPPPGGQLGTVTFGAGGVPAVDPRGRLLYLTGSNQPGVMTLRLTMQVPPQVMAGLNKREDSARVIRVDLATRRVDTLAALKNTLDRRTVETDSEGRVLQINNMGDALPQVDEWTMLPDGSVAVVRAKDYHIDWIDSEGRRTSTPRMAFDWQIVSEDRKRALIDSSLVVVRERVAPASDGRGGRGAAGAPGTPPAAPNIAVPQPLNEIPDSVPPFPYGARAVQADREGNIWIRTSTVLNGRPVYDIVNRRGEVFDRVQIPAFRTIVGFGPGVLYMAVVETGGAVRLERARIK
jgi:hypothetical protein